MKKIQVLSVLMMLTGCASGKDTGFACPAAGFMPEASSIAFFAHAVKNPSPADVNVYAVLRNLEGSCKTSHNNQTEIALRFDAVAQKTPAGKSISQQNLSYFIALLGPDDTILQRARFYTTVPFTKKKTDAKNIDGDTGISSEEHVIKIPLTKPEDATHDRILIGFLLTPEQLDFNKAYHNALTH
jgi:hypothetical protein